MRSVYPELFEVASETLGLKTLFEPEIPDQERRKEYTILGYPDYATDILVDTHGRNQRPQTHILDVADPWLCATLDFGEAPTCGGLTAESRLWPTTWCSASHITRSERPSCLYASMHTLGGLLCKASNLAWAILQEASNLLMMQDWNIKGKYFQECRKQLSTIERPRWMGRERFQEFQVSGTVASRVYNKGHYETREEKLGLLEFLDSVEPFIHLGLCELIIKSGPGHIQEFHLLWRGL